MRWSISSNAHKITLPTSSSPKPMQVYAKRGSWVCWMHGNLCKKHPKARFNMNHDEPIFLVVATQQGLHQLGTTTPIEKAISNYQVTRKSPNASCQVPSVATPGVCPAHMAPVTSFDILWYVLVARNWLGKCPPKLLVKLQLRDNPSSPSSFARRKWATSSPARLMPRTWSSSALGIKSSCTLGDRSLDLGRLEFVDVREQQSKAKL